MFWQTATTKLGAKSKEGSKIEEGNILVGLKFVYVAIWIDAESTGKFHPEERSLGGAIKLGSG